MHREANLYDHYFSNFGRPPVPDDLSKDSATRNLRFWRTRFLKVFPIQMHREANLTLPLKGQMLIYNIYFINFGRPPIPNYLSKDSAQRYPRFGEEDF